MRLGTALLAVTLMCSCAPAPAAKIFYPLFDPQPPPVRLAGRNQRSVAGVALAAGHVDALETRWGTPLESKLPPVEITAVELDALDAWLDAAHPDAAFQARAAAMKVRIEVVPSLKVARTAYVAAVNETSLTPVAEARFELDFALDRATTLFAEVATRAAGDALVARSAEFPFKETLRVDTRRIADGTDIDPMYLEPLSLERLRSFAAGRARDHAPRVGAEVAAEQRALLAPYALTAKKKN